MTLAQRRVLIAFMRLSGTSQIWRRLCLHRWLFPRWGTRLPGDLTPAQARHASRQLNAWRYGIDGGKTR